MGIKIRARRYGLERSTPWAEGFSGRFYPEINGTYEQMEPAREGSIHSDVLVPLLQALITGTFGGTIIGLVTWALVSQDAALYALGSSFGLITTAVWLSLLYDHKQLLWRVERLVGEDFDGDGVIGEPERLVVEVRTPGPYGDNAEFIHLLASTETGFSSSFEASWAESL